MVNKELFHIHTYRCKHAENISDEEYIKKAIELGATKITFCDHSPFPGDLFGNRMKYEELPEYINTLNTLKEKYKDKIIVEVGLEIEYLPSFDKNGYYKQLSEMNGLDILILGQHFYEYLSTNGDTPLKNGYCYSFQNLTPEKRNKIWIGAGEATIAGIKTGYFKVVAHPDRLFRMFDRLTPETKEMADRIINAALENNILLEVNHSSMKTERYFKDEFWERVPDKNFIIHGLDAHCLEQIEIIENK